MKYRLLFVSFLLVGVNLKAQGPLSRKDANIDKVYTQHGLSGKEVLTIMMDRGLDYRHPDFRNADGSTRLAYLYDMFDDSGARDSDNPYGIGTIYTEDEINAALANDRELFIDYGGHGTATTGIFCGNGTALNDNEKFRGVAYNSKIISIVVAVDGRPSFNGRPAQSNLWNSELLKTAFEFAKDKSKELDLPSVALLNAGSIAFPTDGSTSFCRMVDDYIDDGRLFVCGVGDDGGSDNHASRTLQPNETTTLRIRKGEQGLLRTTIWYSEEDRVDVSVTRPDGSIVGPYSSPKRDDDYIFKTGDDIGVFQYGADVENSGSDQPLRQIVVDIRSGTGDYKINFYGDDIRSNVKYHAFLNPSRLANKNRFLNHVIDGSIHEFASCQNVIAPSDHVTSTSFTDINGNRYTSNQGDDGEIWLGSSQGPTMDGRYGVDFTAPGESAIGAYSLDSYYGTFDWNIVKDGKGYYGKQNAVSGAAPIAAGVVALLLEINPSLDQQEVKEILQNSARSDRYTGSVPNNIWGYGKLDALEAVNQTLRTVPIDNPDFPVNTVEIYPNPTSNNIQVTFPNNEEVICLKIIDQHGRTVKMISDFTSKEPIDLSGLVEGFYIAHIDTNNGIVSKKIIKIKEN